VFPFLLPEGCQEFLQLKTKINIFIKSWTVFLLVRASQQCKKKTSMKRVSPWIAPCYNKQLVCWYLQKGRPEVGYSSRHPLMLLVLSQAARLRELRRPEICRTVQAWSWIPSSPLKALEPGFSVCKCLAKLWGILTFTSLGFGCDWSSSISSAVIARHLFCLSNTSELPAFSCLKDRPGGGGSVFARECMLGLLPSLVFNNCFSIVANEVFYLAPSKETRGAKLDR